MYLISQMWWYLLLAFLLGTAIGYLLWRLCSQPFLESRFALSRTDLVSRLALLEEERNMFTGVSADAGAETTTLKSELAALQSKHDGNIRESTIARDLEAKLKTELAAAKVRASTLDGDLAKSKSDATSRHAEELKTAREQVAAEWSAKLAAEIKKARDEVTASLMSARAAEAKKFQDAAKSHEAKVLALSQADTSARSELEAAKSRHAEELKTAREGAAAEAASRHAEEVARLKMEHHATLATHREEIAKFRSASAAGAVAASSAVVAAGVANASKSGSANELPKQQSDDLKLIWGVGPELEKLLNQNGITRFEQIAQWTGKDLIWCDSILPQFKGRAVSEKWVEQCRRLASGFRPEREIGDRPSDILTAPRGGKADDLKLIWGVGPKLEKMLNDAGFYHFDQIAKWTDREIAWVDSKLGDFAGRAIREKWVEQCKKLATGWRPDNDTGDKPT